MLRDGRVLVHQSFADNAAKRLHRTIAVPNAERGSLIVAEIEFGQITLEMPLADVMIRSIDCSLHDGKVAFSRC